MGVVAVYVYRFRKQNIMACMPLLVPILWLLIMISWALGRLLFFYLEDCEKKGCNWTSTIPTIPTVIIAFLIAILGLAVYCEVIHYFATKKYRTDMPIDEHGKLGIDVPGIPVRASLTKMNSLKCC